MFNKTRSPAAVKYRYGSLRKLFVAILKLDNWTGNGSQDPDLEKKLGAARNSSLEIPSTLTVNAIKKFKSCGFYDLFNSR